MSTSSVPVLNRFDTFFDRLIGSEGGYTSGKGDPGGETNWGISKRSYPHLNIKTLTRIQAAGIYKRDFWDKINANELEDGVAYQLFDSAVNSGIDQSIRFLQRAVGVADDGVWGKISQAALDKMSESDVIMRFLSIRLDFMTKLSNWPLHGRGWARRIAMNLFYGAEDSE